jgi:hypothetical protein
MFGELKVDVVILACAASAGVHGALAPEHFQEGVAPGTGFVVSTVLLAALAVALTRNPTQRTLLAAVALFSGLIAAYALVVATGIPLLHPEREQLDGLALATKAIEAAGLVLAASLVRRPAPLLVLNPKGTLT